MNQGEHRARQNPMTPLQIVLWPVFEAYILWQRIVIKWNDLRILYMEFQNFRLAKRAEFLRKQLDDLKAKR